jgi:O-antigen/teichoic acid export membrane protein
VLPVIVTGQILSQPVLLSESIALLQPPQPTPLTNDPLPDGDGRRRAAAWGALLGYASTMLAVARNIVLVPVYLRFFSLAEYGAWLATGAALVQIIVTDFGLSGVLMQKVSALHGARDSRRLGQVISSGILASIGLAVLLTVLCLAATPLMPVMKGLNSLETSTVRNCILLAVAANALGIVSSMSFGIVRSFQHALVAGIAVFVADLINIAATLLLLVTGAGLYSIPCGLIVRSALSAAFLLGYLMYLCRTQFEAKLTSSLSEIRELFVDSWRSFWSSLALKLQTQSNVFFVGVFLSPQAAAIYGLTVRAQETISSVLTQINLAMLPSLAHLLGSKNETRFKALFLRMLPAMSLFAAAGVVAVVSVNKSFVALWVSPTAFAGQTVSVLAGLAVWVAAIGSMAYDSLYARGEFKAIARTFSMTALLHVLVLVALLRFGLWAAPTATLISTVLWGLLFWRKVLTQMKFAVRDLRGPFTDVAVTAGVGSLSVFGLLHWAVQPTNWFQLIVTAIGIVAGFLLAVFACSARMRAVIKEEGRITWQALHWR